MNENKTRPITLYVSRFEFENISVEYMKKKRVTVIDLEMDYIEADKLIKFLQEKIKKDHGAIRIRIYGNLVIS